MKTQKPAKTWTPTRHQNLLRHKSGRYYARAYTGGKEIWQSLKTSHLSVAQAKVAEFLKDHRQRVSNKNSEVSAKTAFGEAKAIHLQNLDDNPKIKPRTREYWRQRLVALLKSWQGLSEMEVRRITQADCRKWASAYRKKASPTNYNNTIAVLRHVLNVAIEAGVICNNPADALERTSVRGKEIALPSIGNFNALIVEMNHGHSRYSRSCADFALALGGDGNAQGRSECARMARR